MLGCKFIVTAHAGRFLRSSPPPHRVFASRRRGADEGADEKSGRNRRCRRSRLPITAIFMARLNFTRKRPTPGSSRSSACEAYMAPGSIKDRPNSQRDAAYHFTLLARNETGYRNLVKLISTAHLDGIHYKPRIDKELLADALRGFDRDERLPQGRDQHGDPGRSARQGARERGDISRHSRRGEFLPRVARSRNRGAAEVQPRSADDREGIRARVGRGQRCALSASAAITKRTTS